MYAHTQRAGRSSTLLLALGVLLLAGSAAVPEWGGRLVLAGVGALLAGFAWVFRSLSITVADGVLAWSFGPGVFGRTVTVDDVVSAEPTRTRLSDGWGIHRTPRGRLYNVAGRDAVWVRLRSGRELLLGTDEPERLAAAILAARSSPVPG
jgi:hypothetical protein